MGAFEKHYTSGEIAEIWHVSEKTAYRMFRNEPGVLKLDCPETRNKRGYCSIRIPESVMVRVYARRSQNIHSARADSARPTV